MLAVVENHEHALRPDRIDEHPHRRDVGGLARMQRGGHLLGDEGFVVERREVNPGDAREPACHA